MEQKETKFGIIAAGRFRQRYVSQDAKPRCAHPEFKDFPAK
jgi:hypothetical protein